MKTVVYITISWMGTRDFPCPTLFPDDVSRVFVPVGITPKVAGTERDIEMVLEKDGLLQPYEFSDLLRRLGGFGYLYKVSASYITKDIAYFGCYEYTLDTGALGEFNDYDCLDAQVVPDDPKLCRRLILGSPSATYAIDKVCADKLIKFTATCPNCHATGKVVARFDEAKGAGSLTEGALFAPNLDAVGDMTSVGWTFECADCGETIFSGDYETYVTLSDCILAAFPLFVASVNKAGETISDTRAARCLAMPEWQTALINNQVHLLDLEGLTQAAEEPQPDAQ